MKKIMLIMLIVGLCAGPVQATPTEPMSRLHQIYTAGQQLGNRPNVFAKVGDSITYSWAFLFDFRFDYDLASYTYLQPALDYYVGPNGIGVNPFVVNPPTAAYPGWTSDDVLIPGNAQVAYCGDFTPLACAYMVEQPAIALIMLGTNDAAENVRVDIYEEHMRHIVAISIQYGVIPVLSTLPPLVGHEAVTDAYNDRLRAIARDQNIPLIDYAADLVPLPVQGMSTDGVHPNVPPDRKSAFFDTGHLQYGFNVLNLGRLQMLYELMDEVE